MCSTTYILRVDAEVCTSSRLCKKLLFVYFVVAKQLASEEKETKNESRCLYVVLRRQRVKMPTRRPKRPCRQERDTAVLGHWSPKTLHGEKRKFFFLALSECSVPPVPCSSHHLNVFLAFNGVIRDAQFATKSHKDERTSVRQDERSGLQGRLARRAPSNRHREARDSGRVSANVDSSRSDPGARLQQLALAQSRISDHQDMRISTNRHVVRVVRVATDAAEERQQQAHLHHLGGETRRSVPATSVGAPVAPKWPQSGEGHEPVGPAAWSYEVRQKGGANANSVACSGAGVLLLSPPASRQA